MLVLDLRCFDFVTCVALVCLGGVDCFGEWWMMWFGLPGWIVY